MGTAFQCKAGTSQHRETTAPVKQHLLKIKSPCYKPALDGREQAASSPECPLSLESPPSFPQGPSLVLLSSSLPVPVNTGHQGPISFLSFFSFFFFFLNVLRLFYFILFYLFIYFYFPTVRGQFHVKCQGRAGTSWMYPCCTEVTAL